VRIRLAIVVLALAAALAATAERASAHGMLQLEVLTKSDVFVPPWAQGGAYNLSPTLLRRLDAKLAALRAQGTPTKVVLIAQRVDLQDVQYFFGDPVAYATFLEQLLESVRVFDGPLIVVMPSGVAETAGAGPPVSLGLRPAMKSMWDIDAVARVALKALDEHPKLPPSPSVSSVHHGSGTDWGLWAALAGAAALAAAVVAVRLSRRGGRPPGEVSVPGR